MKLLLEDKIHVAFRKLQRTNTVENRIELSDIIASVVNKYEVRSKEEILISAIQNRYDYLLDQYHESLLNASHNTAKYQRELDAWEEVFSACLLIFANAIA